MDPHGKTSSSRSNDAEDPDNGVPEELKFITLDSTNLLTPEVSSEDNACENKLSILPKTPEIKELSISATQTPLTLAKLALIQSSSERQSIDSTTPTISTYDPRKCVENAELPRVSNLNEMSIKISREATTQATPPHPSLLRGMSTNLEDTYEVSTSLCSSRSGPKSEILTVTTEYGNQSPDAHSMLADAIDQSEFVQTHQGNRGPHFVHPRTLEQPPPIMDSRRNDLPARRANPRRWSLSSCLRCTSAINDEPDTLSHMRDAPPTYSTIYANHTNLLSNRVADQSSFIAPTPPPSYAQAQGICQSPYSMDHFLSTTPSTRGFWTPRPTTAICPRCLAIVITMIEVRQSRATHVAAFVLFLCGCWPCCVIPYCANSCKNIDHYCPICRSYLGTYQPW